VRLLLVQFGNYAEAVHRFAQGGDENYYAQRYTVDYVAGLARIGYQVRVISIGEDAPLEQLPSGVESIGLRVYSGRLQRPRIRDLIGTAAAWQPTHLLLQVPMPQVLRWAVRNRVETLPLLYDSFRAGGLRKRLRYHQLASALNDRAIRWIGNHGPDAAADLVRIGVNPDKVVPFDWPPFMSPETLPPKKAPAEPGKIRLAYAGQITKSKGVGDLIRAIVAAKAKGEYYTATLAGTGEIEAFRSLASALGVDDRLQFKGRISHSEVLILMNEGDVVVVPSHHDYPEGVPMTIYEGLASRTPVVVSDHPMFRSRIVHQKNAIVFHASNPHSLYEAIHEVVRDRSLYERLSAEADKICANFLGPLKWDQLITRWLAADAENDVWLRKFALSCSNQK